MKKLLTCIFALCVIFGSSIGCAAVNRDKTAVAENVTAVASPVLNSAPNPYEDPEDPNTSSEGTCFSTNSMTGYFMEVKLTQQSTGIVHPDYVGHWGDWSGAFAWSDKTSEATAILTFVDIKYNNHSVFVSVFTKVRYKVKSIFHNPRLWCQEDFTEEKGNAIRIPKSYYNFMKWEQENNGSSLRRFNLTFMKNNGKDVMPLKYTQEVDVRLYTKDIPADSDDPIVKDPDTGEAVWNPNFVLDNWAGIMSSAVKDKGCKNILPWLKTNWQYLLIGVVAVIVVCLFIRLIRWLIGK